MRLLYLYLVTKGNFLKNIIYNVFRYSEIFTTLGENYLYRFGRDQRL